MNYLFCIMVTICTCGLILLLARECVSDVPPPRPPREDQLVAVVTFEDGSQIRWRPESLAELERHMPLPGSDCGGSVVKRCDVFHHPVTR